MVAETENTYEVEYVRDGIKTLHEIIGSNYFDLIMKLNLQLITENERIDRIPVLNEKSDGVLSRIFSKRR